MRSGYYRSGQAAKVWDISSHLVRRLCEAGLIKAERTDGGQWKIPHSEVQRIRREGVPEIPSSVAEDDCKVEVEDESVPENNLPAPHHNRVVTHATEFVSAESGVRQEKIEGDPGAMQTRFRECQTGEFEARSRESEASLGRAAQIPAERERIAWLDSWLAKALRSLPLEAPPEIRLAVREAVSDAIENLGPQHSWLVIELLVNAAVAKALRPWNQERETAKAIETACNSLPWGARNSFSPTVWQARAQEVAAAAIRRLPADSDFFEKTRVSSAAVTQITSEFEDDDLRKRILQAAYLINIASGEWESAREAIRKKLESLPRGTSLTAMENAREQALAPFRESQKRNLRVELALVHIRRYIDQLRLEEEVEFDSDGDVSNFVKSLERRLRPVLIQELIEDDLSDEELSELVEELADEALG